MRRFSKAIAALIGGLTPPVVVAILAAFGVHMDLHQAGEIIGAASAILALAATAAAPANQQPTTAGASSEVDQPEPTESADGSMNDAGSTGP